MKAWGSKKIFRGDDVAQLETLSMDQFSGPSVQRPFLRSDSLPPSPVEPADAAPEIVADSEPTDQGLLEPAPQVEMPSQAAIDVILEAARAEGYQAGHEEGRRAGYALGEKNGHDAGFRAGQAEGNAQGRAEAAADLAQFKAILRQLESVVQEYEAALTKPIIDLAIAISRQVIRTSLAVEPERMQAVVREALNSLPELQPPLKFELHPDDAALIHAMFNDAPGIGQWRFEHDASIERGGCRIGSASVEVDLTLPVRWRRIIESLGRDDSWAEDSRAD
jgi:flagellar assembly protein FliH